MDSERKKSTFRSIFKSILIGFYKYYINSQVEESTKLKGFKAIGEAEISKNDSHVAQVKNIRIVVENNE